MEFETDRKMARTMNMKKVHFGKERTGDLRGMKSAKPMQEGISKTTSEIAGILKTGSTSERVAAAKALGKLREMGVVGHLIEAMEDEEPEVREAVVEAIAQVGDKAAIPAMVAALEDTDGVVARAIIALGKFGDKSVIPSLRQLYDDPTESIRALARDTVASFNKNAEYGGITSDIADYITEVAGECVSDATIMEILIEEGINSDDPEVEKLSRRIASGQEKAQDARPEGNINASDYEKLMRKCMLAGTHMGDEERREFEDEVIELASSILQNINTMQLEYDYSEGLELGPEEEIIENAAGALVDLGSRGVLALVEVMRTRVADMVAWDEDGSAVGSCFGDRLLTPLLEKGSAEDLDAFEKLIEEHPELKGI